MTYTAKTNWTAVDGVSAADLNRIEQGISDITTSALPATSYTAADVLTKIKTVDGSGSGLDADLFDGLESSVFVRKTLTSATDLNTVIETGFYDGSSLTNAPSAIGTGWAYIVVIRHTNDATTNRWIQQVAYDFNTGIQYTRQSRGGTGTWSSWAQIWDSSVIPQTRNNSGVYEWHDGTTFKAVGGVKNVQRGLATLPADTTTTLNVTISAVNLSKSFVTISQNGSSNSALAQFAYGRLTSTTNLEITRATNSITTNVAWEVVESY